MKKLGTVLMYIIAVIILGGCLTEAKAETTDVTSKYGSPFGCRVYKVTTGGFWDSGPDLFVFQCPTGLVGSAYEYRQNKTTKRVEVEVIPNQDNFVRSALQKLTPQERKALGY